ncbi:CsbD family protein [Leptolyngbya sp. FACHB-261]|uniref:CsbD family protein n=1 Tax=Leptolyngbya sp. FACHB-261 TaxID=2692806 RepID=UPI0016885998|nr:CsbD family protein [Leptolyngbya sp. FACHB-261]MBD2104975.1 CsbD family protein [Leptolyngbya sp. FACHB-261]
MSAEDRAKATGKNLEGKVQEAWGKVTGDPEDQLEGQAKQGQAQAMHAKENIKEKAKEIVDEAL